EEEELLNPATLFDIHNQGFNQKLINTANGIAYIELYPQEKKNFEKIGIWVNPTTFSVQKVTSFGKDGNKVTITIKTIKELNPVPHDSFFSFDKTKHPEVEVIDMR
ncbi:MAG: outer-membrane lipoprotein carrier protein LolA, partial [Odoribacter sp.]|nr:outer-membrane lipoprotein carrier protein LolA [Odoribacter sp.]